MGISNFGLFDARTCLVPQGGTVYATFDLVNKGGSGFARVAFQLDGVTTLENQYSVPSGSHLPVEQAIFVADCGIHSIAAQITTQWPS